MTKIADYKAYTDGMRHSINDKLFFTEALKTSGIQNFVDFGCADGELLKHVERKFPEMQMYGIDMDRTMLLKAQQNVPHAFFIESKLPTGPEHAALNLSSVLHEVYSYCAEEEIEAFWNAVNDNHYSLIFIRDMMFIDDDLIVSDDVIDKLVEKCNADKELRHMFNEYMVCHNCKMNYKTLTEFLLKYRYKTNWNREVKEKYFSYDRQTLFDNLKNYNLIYIMHNQVPFIKNKIQEDFGIDLTCCTHYQAIFQLKPQFWDKKIA